MRKSLLGVLAIAVLLSVVLAARQATVARPRTLTDALAEIDARISADFAKDGIGGLSVGVVSGKQLIWSKHYGYAETESKRVANNDTTYRVGSITKQFTALALLQLVEQGRMQLTDPLEKYVPEVRQVKDQRAGTPPIVLLQVATMYAGLAREPACQDHSVGPNADWQKIVLRCLPETSYVNNPGTTYLYSNIGYATLGLAIERAGGAPLIDQITTRILKPLGMAHSGLEATPAVRANLAHGYVRASNGSASRTAPDRELDGRGYRVPNGALFSTVNDLAKFVAWELGEGPAGILNADTQEANYHREFPAGANVGYGVGFQSLHGNMGVVLGHGGSTAGYHSSALFHRASKIGVIVLRSCDSCTVDAGPVAARAIEQLIAVSAIR
jgi:CubicO group peptidase (beta-lactamase class C family)